MSWYNCWPQNLSKLMIGILFSIMGLGAVIIGLTVLPVIGLILSVPAFGLGFYFIRSHLNRQCEIS